MLIVAIVAIVAIIAYVIIGTAPTAAVRVTTSDADAERERIRRAELASASAAYSACSRSQPDAREECQSASDAASESLELLATEANRLHSLIDQVVKRATECADASALCAAASADALPSEDAAADARALARTVDSEERMRELVSHACALTNALAETAEHTSDAAAAAAAAHDDAVVDVYDDEHVYA